MEWYTEAKRSFLGIPRSSNGRTAAFGAVNRGSNPCRGANSHFRPGEPAPKISSVDPSRLQAPTHQGLTVFGQQFAILPDRVREYKIKKFSFFLGWLVLEQLVS